MLVQAKILRRLSKLSSPEKEENVNAEIQRITSYLNVSSVHGVLW